MRKVKPIPPLEKLQTIVVADFDGGKLIWTDRAVSDFPDADPKYLDWWNANKSGCVVAPSSCVSGGFKVRLFGSEYYLHRVLYKMAHNEEPPVIDHIDGDRSNNSLSNLRAANDALNMKNKARYRNNLSGHANVSKDRAMWRVSFKVDGRRISVGSFPTIEQAIAARDAAKATLGFHPNHGRAA